MYTATGVALVARRRAAAANLCEFFTKETRSASGGEQWPSTTQPEKVLGAATPCVVGLGVVE